MFILKAYLKIQNRYIIEQKIRHVKLNGLRNIPNTSLGHSYQDYRNASAMLNFNLLYNEKKYRKTHSEKLVEKKIAITLRTLCTAKITKNIEFLIDITFNQNNVKKELLENVNDFPSLSQNKINEKLALSGFQTKWSISYLQEFRERNICFYLSEKKILSITNHTIRSSLLNDTSKIIIFEVNSRHSRSIDNAKNKKVQTDYDTESIPKKKTELKNKNRVYIHFSIKAEKKEWKRIKGNIFYFYFLNLH